jgi:ABC-2 type transport system ATP-binding protein
MVSITDLTFAFKKNHLLFNGLNLDLQAGSIYGLFGLNGAGKTTLLNHISGLLFPKSGTCEILGKSSRKRDPETLSELYVLPEQFDLPPIPAHSYVNIHAPFYPRFDEEYMKHSLRELLVEGEKNLNELSYGQRKKFLIAFALATNARLLLMDEPTNGLDIPSKSQFRKIMAASDHSKRCVVISTHQVRDLEAMIDHLTVLNDGKIIFHQGIDNIAKKLSFEKIAEDDNRFVLYSEEIFGGKAAIIPKKTDSNETQIDLELLFNGIIQKGDVINQQFVREAV